MTYESVLLSLICRYMYSYSQATDHWLRKYVRDVKSLHLCFKNINRTTHLTVVHCKAALLRHNAAQVWSLVGLSKTVSTDAMGFEDVQQLRDGLFRKCAGSAHDPGKLSMKETGRIRAGVNQGVVVIISGQHPVGGRRSIWKRTHHNSDLRFLKNKIIN